MFKYFSTSNLKKQFYTFVIMIKFNGFLLFAIIYDLQL